MTSSLQPGAPRARRVVEVSATFPGSAIPADVYGNPKEMTLTQRMKSHDILTLTYETEMPDAKRLLRTGSPVTVTWGTTNINDSQTWVGYVHTTSPRRTGNASGTTTITCVSPSMLLKQASQQTWINTPVMSVAANIANLAGLEILMEDHPLADTIIQHGRTYWQVLRDIATLTGYSLTTDNTQLIMVPHRTFFEKYANRARIFNPGASLELSPKNTDRTLYSFIPDWSDLSEDEYALHASMTTWAIDPRTGNIKVAQQQYPTRQIAGNREAPLVNRFNSQVAYDIDEAQRLSSDVLADRRWVNQGTLIGVGSPDLRPYMPVYVNEMSDAVNGWWQILSVDHEIQNRTEYTATMRVGRDGGEMPFPKPDALPALSDLEVTLRAADPVVKRVPSFIPSTDASVGLTGFGDVGGRWISSST